MRERRYRLIALFGGEDIVCLIGLGAWREPFGIRRRREWMAAIGRGGSSGRQGSAQEKSHSD